MAGIHKLENYKKFNQDIQGSSTNLYPVVVIGNYDPDQSFSSNQYIAVSTNSGFIGGFQLRPILMAMPSLTESIDISKRNYKISSISLNLSNFEYDGSRFSNLVEELTDFSPNTPQPITRSLINTECRIYWVSQSINDLQISYLIEDNPDNLESNAYPMYYGTIRRYVHDDEKVTLSIEDRSQTYLHQDLPLPKNYLGDDAQSKYVGKPIPMVYGRVDRSPCVIKTAKYDDNDLPISIKLAADSKSVDFIENDIIYNTNTDGSENTLDQRKLHQSALYFFENDKFYNALKGNYSEAIHDYWQVFQYTDSELNFDYNNENGEIEFLSSGRYTKHDNIGYIIKKPFTSAKIQQQGEATDDYNVKYFNGEEGSNILDDDLPEGISNLLDGKPNTFVLAKGKLLKTGVELAGVAGVTSSYFQLEYQSENLDNGEYWDVEGDDTSKKEHKVNFWIVAKVIHEKNYDNQISDTSWGIWSSQFNMTVLDTIDNDHQYHLREKNDLRNYTTANYNSIDDQEIGDYADNVAYPIESNESESKWQNINLGFPKHSQYSYSSYSNIHTKFYEIYGILSAVTDKLSQKKYYANVVGRVSEKPSIPEIIQDVLLNELGLTSDIDIPENEYEDFNYQFTINKKTNSKKLFQNLSSASPFIPRFNNVGSFKFDVIKTSYHNFDVIGGQENGSANHSIKEQDCISWSYKRTKIEDVVTKIVVKYNWNYARDEFDGIDIPDIFVSDIYGVNYRYDYYGLPEDDSQSTLVLDDDRMKYIRDRVTAEKLAYWILSMHCNQHLIMNVDLPLSKGLNLEVGDIVEFEKVLGGVAPYGIQYSKNSNPDNRKPNHQQYFPYFMITSTNKKIDSISIECIMMHKLETQTCPTTLYDCTGECGGNVPIDVCGTCGGDVQNVEDCEICPEGFDADCEGVCGGSALVDECGICNGGGKVTCWDGSEVCNEIDCPEDQSDTQGVCTSPLFNTKNTCEVNGHTWMPNCFHYCLCLGDELNPLNDPVNMSDLAMFLNQNYQVSEGDYTIGRPCDISSGNQMLYGQDFGSGIKVGELKFNTRTIDNTPWETRCVEARLEISQSVAIGAGENPNITIKEGLKILYADANTSSGDGSITYSNIGNNTKSHIVFLTTNTASDIDLIDYANLTEGEEFIINLKLYLTYEASHPQEGTVQPLYYIEEFRTQYTYQGPCHLGDTGDINNDGFYNILDVVMMTNCILEENCQCGDLNDDGLVNILDLVTLVNCVLEENCGG
ncbi:MAG: hypothetical protein Unbinned4139contig1000_12 [Prokaryotic dsDNA virus sp.]|nr:MAG: hypothetical protein Unbinned4139contig1000_12 [Prokaryotic dsDNA virus sp.]